MESSFPSFIHSKNTDMQRFASFTLLLLAVLFVMTEAQAQYRATEATVDVDKMSMSAASVNIDAPKDEVEKYFIKQLEQRYNVDMDKARNKRGATSWASDEPIVVPGMGSNKVTIYAKFDEISDNSTGVYLTTAAGQNSLNSYTNPREFLQLQSLTNEISSAFHRVYFAEQLEEAVEEVEDVRKDREKLREENMKLQESIAKNNERIAKLREEIAQAEQKIKENEMKLNDTSELDRKQREAEMKREKLNNPRPTSGNYRNER